MKTRVGGFLFTALVALSSFAQSPLPKLTGIVDVEKQQRAVLELRLERGGFSRPILRAGEREGQCEVVSINPDLGAVSLLWGKDREPMELRLPFGEDLPRRSAVHLQNTDLRQALELYQTFSGRTVVYSPRLVLTSINLRTPPNLTMADSAEALAKAIQATGVVLREREAGFAFAVMPKDEERLSGIRSAPAAGDPKKDEVFPAGLIKFQDADVLQALEIYAELVGRTILRPQRYPFFKVTVRSQTALSRLQAAWLLEASMALGDMALVPCRENFAFAVSFSQVDRLPDCNRVAAQPQSSGNEPLAIKLNDADTLTALKLYAELIRREPVTNGLPQARMSLRAQSPLSATNAVFALEAVAALNNLGFENVGADGVTMRPAAALKERR